MSILNTKPAQEAAALKALLMKIPEGQKANWDNGLIPYFVARLKEWVGGPLEGTDEENWQYANLLIKNKFLHEFVLLRKLPFPQDFAEALEWTLMAGEACADNRKQMTGFQFIYRNFEIIMKKIPCLKTKRK